MSELLAVVPFKQKRTQEPHPGADDLVVERRSG
jgi:hypothetical protein